MNGIIIVLIALAGIIIFWFIQNYNTFIRLKAMADEAWSGISVQLKRRADLIPNLVAVVKQYSIHERDVLENVTRLRTASMEAKSITQKAEAENALSGALKTLFAVAENYPDLKANTNFLALQQELSTLENELQMARRYYNGAARNYNILVESFPTNLIASTFQFSKMPFFELENPEDRNVPNVKF